MLAYYPFDKNMDKYGTMYVSVFCQRYSTNVDNSAKFAKSKEIISNVLSELNWNNNKHSYHYVSMENPKRIIYNEVL